jgi:hypothetical protein
LQGHEEREQIAEFGFGEGRFEAFGHEGEFEAIQFEDVAGTEADFGAGGVAQEDGIGGVFDFVADPFLIIVEQGDVGFVSLGECGTGKEDGLEEIRARTDGADAGEIRAGVAAVGTDGVTGGAGRLGTEEDRVSAVGITAVEERAEGLESFELRLDVGGHVSFQRPCGALQLWREPQEERGDITRAGLPGGLELLLKFSEDGAGESELIGLSPGGQQDGGRYQVLVSQEGEQLQKLSIVEVGATRDFGGGEADDGIAIGGELRGEELEGGPGQAGLTEDHHAERLESEVVRRERIFGDGTEFGVEVWRSKFEDGANGLLADGRDGIGEGATQAFLP